MSNFIGGAGVGNMSSEFGFWLDVLEELEGKFQVSPEHAREWIRGYQQRMEQLGAISVVYHSNASQIAEAISGQRFREPWDRA